MKRIYMIAAFVVTISNVHAQEQRLPGLWYLLDERNPLDDSRIVYVWKEIELDVGYYDIPPDLNFRCDGGVMESFITWYTPLLGDGIFVDTITTQMRFGSEPAIADRWLLSLDSEATFYPGDVRDFIEKLESVDQFVVSMTVQDLGQFLVVWSMVGFSEAIQNITETC